MRKNLKISKKITVKKEDEMVRSNRDDILRIYKERAQINRKEFDASVKRLTNINRQMRRLFGFPEINKNK